MSLKAMKCPSCGADIELDTSREFGFCNYCGTKIQLHEVIEVRHSGSVSIDHSSDIQQLVDNCETQIKFREYAKAYEYASILMEKYSNEPRGYMLAIRIITQDYNEQRLETISDNDANIVRSYLSKLKVLDSSYESFCQNGYLFLKIVDAIKTNRNLEAAKKIESSNTNDGKNTCGTWMGLSAFFSIFGIVPLMVGIDGLNKDYSTTFVGRNRMKYVNAALDSARTEIGVGIIIIVICIAIFAFCIYKKNQINQSSDSNVNIIEKNLNNTNEMIKKWKTQLYKRY